MKIAAARAIAALAREDVPDEVDAAYSGRRLRYGPEYIIPVPFDPRLIVTIPAAVAHAAMESGVARKPIIDVAGYRNSAAHPARPDGGQPPAHLREGQGQPPPRRLRRGRGGPVDPRGPGLPRGRLRHADPDRARGDDPRAVDGARAQARSGRAGNPQRPAVRRQPPLYRLPLPPAPAPGHCCSATASAWSTRTATSSRR